MEPIYVVKMSGVVRGDEMERIADYAHEHLGGTVLVVDDRIDDIWMLSEDDGRRIVKMLEEQLGAGDADDGEL